MKKVFNEKAKVPVFIERASDGVYSAYMPEDSLSFGAIGEGSTATEAKEDFLRVVADYLADGEYLPEGTEFEFNFDVASFLGYYGNRLTLAGLSRITGVAQGQLSHYVTGHRKPSQRTAEKIQNSLHTFAEDLKQVHLI